MFDTELLVHAYGVAIVVGEGWRDDILKVNIITVMLITAKHIGTDEQNGESCEDLEELISAFSEKDNNYTRSRSIRAC